MKKNKENNNQQFNQFDPNVMNQMMNNQPLNNGNILNSPVQQPMNNNFAPQQPQDSALPSLVPAAANPNTNFDPNMNALAPMQAAPLPTMYNNQFGNLPAFQNPMMPSLYNGGTGLANYNPELQTIHKNKSKNLIIGLSIGAILLLGGAGAGIAYWQIQEKKHADIIKDLKDDIRNLITKANNTLTAPDNENGKFLSTMDKDLKDDLENDIFDAQNYIASSRIEEEKLKSWAEKLDLSIESFKRRRVERQERRVEMRELLNSAKEALDQTAADPLYTEIYNLLKVSYFNAFETEFNIPTWTKFSEYLSSLREAYNKANTQKEQLDREKAEVNNLIRSQDKLIGYRNKLPSTITVDDLEPTFSKEINDNYKIKTTLIANDVRGTLIIKDEIYKKIANNYVLLANKETGNWKNFKKFDFDIYNDNLQVKTKNNPILNVAPQGSTSLTQLFYENSIAKLIKNSGGTGASKWDLIKLTSILFSIVEFASKETSLNKYEENGLSILFHDCIYDETTNSLKISYRFKASVIAGLENSPLNKSDEFSKIYTISNLKIEDFIKQNNTNDNVNNWRQEIEKMKDKFHNLAESLKWKSRYSSSWNAYQILETKVNSDMQNFIINNNVNSLKDLYNSLKSIQEIFQDGAAAHSKEYAELKTKFDQGSLSRISKGWNKYLTWRTDVFNQGVNWLEKLKLTFEELLISEEARKNNDFHIEFYREIWEGGVDNLKTFYNQCVKLGWVSDDKSQEQEIIDEKQNDLENKFDLVKQNFSHQQQKYKSLLDLLVIKASEAQDKAFRYATKPEIIDNVYKSFASNIEKTQDNYHKEYFTEYVDSFSNLSVKISEFLADYKQNKSINDLEKFHNEVSADLVSLTKSNSKRKLITDIYNLVVAQKKIFTDTNLQYVVSAFTPSDNVNGETYIPINGYESVVNQFKEFLVQIEGQLFEEITNELIKNRRTEQWFQERLNEVNQKILAFNAQRAEIEKRAFDKLVDLKIECDAIVGSLEANPAFANIINKYNDSKKKLDIDTLLNSSSSTFEINNNNRYKNASIYEYMYSEIKIYYDDFRKNVNNKNIYIQLHENLKKKVQDAQDIFATIAQAAGVPFEQVAKWREFIQINAYTKTLEDLENAINRGKDALVLLDPSNPNNQSSNLITEELKIFDGDVSKLGVGVIAKQEQKAIYDLIEKIKTSSKNVNNKLNSITFYDPKYNTSDETIIAGRPWDWKKFKKIYEDYKAIIETINKDKNYNNAKDLATIKNIQKEWEREEIEFFAKIKDRIDSFKPFENLLVKIEEKMNSTYTDAIFNTLKENFEKIAKTHKENIYDQDIKETQFKDKTDKDINNYFFEKMNNLFIEFESKAEIISGGAIAPWLNVAEKVRFSIRNYELLKDNLANVPKNSINPIEGSFEKVLYEIDIEKSKHHIVEINSEQHNCLDVYFRITNKTRTKSSETFIMRIYLATLIEENINGHNTSVLKQELIK